MAYLTALLFLLAWAQTVLVSSGGPDQEVDYYAAGMQLAQEGDVSAALNTWMKAREGSPDPRIGIAYIEWTTAGNLQAHYDRASDIYFWGMSGESVAPEQRESLLQEVDRMGPLLELELLNRWREMATEGDPLLLRELAGFWRNVDPTPGTIRNERLLEHWERIAYSREHFTRNRREPFGTDDRGPIFVRYGRPDLVREGQLVFNSSEARGKVIEMMMSGSMEVAAVASSKRSSVSGINYASVANGYVDLAREFYTFPEYEIWVYRDLNSESTEHTLYLFGSKGETGSFEMVQSVEDFIPDRAFSTSTNLVPNERIFEARSDPQPHVDNIRPGLILQLIYYNQLATSDPFFGKMLETLEDRAFDRSPVSVSLGQEMKTLAIMDLVEAQNRSPRQESSQEELLPDIPVDVYQYRALDEENRPVLWTYLRSRPQTAFLEDYLNNYDREFTGSISRISQKVRNQAKEVRDRYRLWHRADLYGVNFEEMDTLATGAPLTVDSGTWTESYMAVPHRSSGVRQRFSAQLINRDSASSFRGKQGLIPDAVRGIGSMELVQSEPLSTDPRQLEMADLILGYGMSAEKAATRAGGPLPFTVSHLRHIPVGEALAVHVEVYHLQQNPDRITDFTLRYEVLERNPGIIRWIDKYRSSASLTLNLQTDVPRYAESLEIKTRELDPGTYLLRIVATDDRSGQQVERSVEFQVIE